MFVEKIYLDRVGVIACPTDSTDPLLIYSNQLVAYTFVPLILSIAHDGAQYHYRRYVRIPS